MSFKHTFTMAISLASLAHLSTPAMAHSSYAKATLQSPSGEGRGIVWVKQTDKGLKLVADITGVPAGTHAIHIHEAGTCSPDFSAAGGHYNPANKEHGLLNPKGAHVGDFPNFLMPAEGRARFAYYPGVTGKIEGSRYKMMDSDGAAIVIHRGADDYLTDPAGAAGDRIACGVLKMTDTGPSF